MHDYAWIMHDYACIAFVVVISTTCMEPVMSM